MTNVFQNKIKIIFTLLLTFQNIVRYFTSSKTNFKKMKTLQEIKNEIAVKNGCENWKDLLSTFHKGEHESFYDKVCIEYFNQKIDYIADDIDFSNCYDGGAHCGRDAHENRIRSYKESI